MVIFALTLLTTALVNGCHNNAGLFCFYVHWQPAVPFCSSYGSRGLTVRFHVEAFLRRLAFGLDMRPTINNTAEFANSITVRGCLQVRTNFFRCEAVASGIQVWNVGSLLMQLMKLSISKMLTSWLPTFTST